MKLYRAKLFRTMLFRIVTRLGISLALVVSTGLSAELLTLEDDGTSRIMAKIRATMNAKAVRTGSLIPWTFSYRTNGSDKIVQVMSPLPFHIKVDGKKTDISLYYVSVNDQEAVLTIASRDDVEAGENQMMIGYSSERKDHGVRYQVNFRDKSVEVKENPPEHPKQASEQKHKIDFEMDIPQALLPTQQEINTARVSYRNQPLTVFVFIHNDVKEKASGLIHEHFSWWAKHMNAFKNRQQMRGNKPLFSELVVDFRSDNKIQQFEYEGKPEDTLRRLAEEFKRYKRDKGIFGSYKRNKFLLMTEKVLDWQTLGIAYIGGQYAIAADDDDQVAAHEIGHMFNGRHYKADVIYSGLWCETILYWQHVFLRSSCHRYSDANMDIISEYLK